MKTIICFVALSFCYTSSFCQLREPSNPNSDKIIDSSGTSYAIFTDKTKIYGSVVRAVGAGVGWSQPHLEIDGKRFELMDVESFKNNLGHFVNVGNGISLRFVEKTKTGKINFYEPTEKTNFFGSGWSSNSIIIYPYAFAGSYYNLSDGDKLLRTTKSNLGKIFGSTSSSMKELNRSKLNGTFMYGCIILGTGMIVGSSQFFIQEKNKEGIGVFLGGLAIGLGGQWYFGKKKVKHMHQAIDMYNQ